jgi:hypothetical protein
VLTSWDRSRDTGVAAYGTAISLTANAVEKAFLKARQRLIVDQ